MDSESPPPAAPVDALDGEEASNPRKRRRQRVLRACDQCRLGKLKCDGAHPQCGTCLENNKSCIYGAVVRRRGLRTGYVRALECLWGLVFRQIEGSECAVQTLLESKHGQNLRPQDDGPLIGAWKASKISQKIEKLLSVVEHSEEDADLSAEGAEPNLRESSPALAWTFTTQSSQIRSDRRTEGDQGSNQSQPEATATPMSNPSDTSQTKIQLPLQGLRIPPNWRQLLDTYFSYSHCWLPMVERHSVFRISYTYRTAQSSLSRQAPESGDHAMLWAILAYTSARSNPMTTEESRTGFSPNINYTPEFMYSVARSLIPTENEGGYTVGHVQALSMLALYRYTAGDWNASSLLLGHARIVAIILRLDQPINLDGHEKQAAIRAWLGCFVLDSLFSARLATRPLFHPEDIEHCIPIEESGLEEWEPAQTLVTCPSDSGVRLPDPDVPSCALSIYNQLLRLIVMFNKALRGHWKQDDMLAFGRWSEELPEQCIPKEVADATNTMIPIIPPNVLNLHLLYTSLLMLLSGNCDSNEKRRSFFHIASRKGYHIVDMLENVSINTTLSRMLPTLDLLAYLMSIPAQISVPCETRTLTNISHALVNIGFNTSNEDLTMQSAQKASGVHDAGSCSNRSLFDGVTIPNRQHTMSIQLPGDERATVASLDVHNSTAGLNNLENFPLVQQSDRLGSRSFENSHTNQHQRVRVLLPDQENPVTTLGDVIMHPNPSNSTAHLSSVPALAADATFISCIASDLEKSRMAQVREAPFSLGEGGNLPDYFSLIDDFESDQSQFERNLGYYASLPWDLNPTTSYDEPGT